MYAHQFFFIACHSYSLLEIPYVSLDPATFLALTLALIRICTYLDVRVCGYDGPQQYENSYSKE